MSARLRKASNKPFPTAINGEEKKQKESLWFAKDPSKQWAEKCFLAISAGWVIFFSAIVVTQIYKNLGDIGFMAIGVAVSAPFIIIPMLFPGQVDQKLAWSDRYWVKANAWIAIMSYVGNYFWTHYFYTVLGAKYSFPVTIELNKVPLFLYLITHAYFCSYHTVTTIILRRFWNAFKPASRFLWWIGSSLLVFLLSIFTAFMETFTISEVPYYSHDDKFLMYTVGSVFYGIYFYVSFPMFYRIDEKSNEKWTLSRTVIDSLAACMSVFIILDLCRLIVGQMISSKADIVPFV